MITFGLHPKNSLGFFVADVPLTVWRACASNKKGTEQKTQKR